VEFSIGSVPGRPARPLPVRERMRHPERPNNRGRLLSDVFDVFPTGIVIVSDQRRLLTWNPAVAEIAGEAIAAATTCCELFGCGRPGTALADGCLTELALSAEGPLPEMILEPPSERGGRAIAVAATSFNRGGRRSVVVEMRAAPAPAASPLAPPLPRRAHKTIRIRTLGETVIETESGELRGDWLDQRPGRLLKFLVAHRYTPMHADTIAEALWPRARTDTTNTVRHFVHALREKLEPARGRYERSAYVLARHGGYVLNSDHVSVDADDFEREAKAGLVAVAANERPAAIERLHRALDLYAGDFLMDERFEDWAIAERERLRDLVTKPLRILAEFTSDRDEATGYLERLAEMEPLDVDIHRELIGLWLRQGRRGRALRHYRALQLRLMRELGERVNFDLSELTRESAVPRHATANW
jgi:DNA-binding SARP family transcriptional activator